MWNERAGDLLGFVAVNVSNQHPQTADK